MDALARLKLRLGLTDDGQDTLLALLLEDATDYILAYTGRKALPAGLVGAQVQLALIQYNRQGTEGDKQYDEGNIRREMELFPEDILRQLNSWRILRTVSLHAPAGTR